jgi:hypothetical protein
MFQTNGWFRSTGIVAIIGLTLTTTGCFKTKLGSSGDVNSTSSPAESAVATLNSLANDSEALNFDAQFESGTCKASAAKSACNALNQINVKWSDCTGSNGQTLSGGWTNTYSDTRACMTAQNGRLASGDSMTRTSDGMVIKGIYGGTIMWSTNRHVTYDNKSISNAGLSINRFGETRSIILNGLHRILQDGNGNTVYDHSIVSEGAIIMSGQRQNGTRMVSSGTVRVYNNTDKFSSDHSFNGVQWKNANCAFPTAGAISSSFSGSMNGFTTLTFQSTCGEATLTTTNGKTETITLKQAE